MQVHLEPSIIIIAKKDQKINAMSNVSLEAKFGDVSVLHVSFAILNLLTSNLKSLLKTIYLQRMSSVFGI